MKLSAYLKARRVKAGLTQGAVAEAIGYTTPQFISNWERGLSYPPLTALTSLSEIYQVSVQALTNKMIIEKNAAMKVAILSRVKG